ncbi:MAG TPA: ribosomal protein S18-alanine N-acetyltransferase [Thermoanaerobaculia bacterium]
MPGSVPSLSIRPARADDLNAVAWLEDAAFRDPWPREMLEGELAHPRALLLIATRGDTPVGYAAFRQAADEAELLRLAVHPAERRRGVARALVAVGLDRLRHGDIQVCFLEVRVDNEPAIQLYRRLGFGIAGRRRAYYRDGTDAIIFALEL